MTPTTKHPRPAQMGTQCDSIYVNPNYTPDGDRPLLIRCHDAATKRIVIVDAMDTYTVKRCQICADVLHAQIERGVTFEVLSEEDI